MILFSLAFISALMPHKPHTHTLGCSLYVVEKMLTYNHQRQQVQYLIVVVAPVTFLLIRFSILLFLHRLVGNGEPGTRIVIKILHVLNFLWYPASVLPPVLMCAPREMRMWNLMAVIRAQCFQPKVVDSMQINSTSMVVLSASFDVACLLVPVRLVWKLRMSTRKKVVISSLFGVGIL